MSIKRPEVVGVVTVFDHEELLSHFLAHYTRLGVDRMFVLARTVEAAVAAKHLAKLYPFVVSSFMPDDGYFEAVKDKGEAAFLKRQDISPDAYMMHLDLDEFHQYPAHLHEVLTVMAEKKIRTVYGMLLDRIAKNGELISVSLDPHIWDQFPVEADLTLKLTKGCRDKVMLCRRDVYISVGRHYAHTQKQQLPLGKPWEYLAHHFKWLAGLAGRLDARIKLSTNQSGAYVEEVIRTVTYIRKHHGRVDIGDKEFNARLAKPVNYWELEE